MENNPRSLSLSIDAKNPDDFSMLLKQALYEINKLLPPPPDSSEEARLRAAGRALMSSNSGEVLKTEGHTEGSIGKYSFEFYHCSREFYALEQSLLDQGYVKVRSTELFATHEDIYKHTSLPSKVITENPPEIHDAPQGK